MASSTLPDCPRTLWSDIDVDYLRSGTSAHPPSDASLWDRLLSPLAAYPSSAHLRDAAPFPAVIESTAERNTEGASFFMRNRAAILEQLRKSGAVWLRGFDLMETECGFQAMYDALGLVPCLDPIHSSGLRKMVAPKQAVYETVNKPSLSKHYVGMHNESTFKKSAVFGAFVCFRPAREGGEFLVADGAEILRRLDPDVVASLCNKKIRISVTNLDFPFLSRLPAPLRTSVKGLLQDLISRLVAPKFDMELEMVWGADGVPHRLQAIEPMQSPVNLHPITKRPLWFCNIHNHSRWLRDRRPCTVPEVGMTEVYHGDLSPIPSEHVEHIDKVTRECIVEIPMQKGDVVLVDNYRTLHGRNIFDGERMHAVTWFKGVTPGEGAYFSVDTKRDTASGEGVRGSGEYDFTAGDLLNEAINKFLVK